MFEFIKQELTEARLFKYPENLEGRDARALGQLLFACLLTLEVLRYENESQAYNYAMKTLAFGDFDHMRSSSTDLANIISVMGNQDKFKDQLKISTGIYAPLLQIKTYLRAYLYGGDSHSRDRQFLIAVERDLGISSYELRTARRIISNWDSSDRGDKSTAYFALKREFQRNGTQIDLWRVFQQFYGAY
jgi:hypothetical protein